MTIAVAATLEPVGEAHIALETVDVQANLRGLMSEVIVTQTYRNLENTNIEAVYTFPLPLDAVLLNLTLELNGKTLKGVVQPKADAEERYEEAIEDGDSAILLQELGGSLFTINVGNILPNEQAVIKFTYAQLHRWQGDSLRFHLPTTIAPRYGDPVAVGLEAHQIPEFALTVDRGFSLAIRIEGKISSIQSRLSIALRSCFHE
jgi:Ca-activated chloride channel family protein